MNSYLDLGNLIKITEKISAPPPACLAALLKTKNSRINEREIKTENYTGLIYQVLVSVYELKQQLYLIRFLFLFTNSSSSFI
ncbi:predicted protein [Methanosarcina acetivorans C2A]|uniref:Uncharacterized protein n=1 Tax=Methanosarcina acetivorans (strain ATCC 35395 / DSM 2834 / JCM 12185 / C2A) TaxID=188937 RepID=Q8TQD2_METAC|nr:predicted protein [Methanosarcina acetivorans C2A]